MQAKPKPIISKNNKFNPQPKPEKVEKKKVYKIAPLSKKRAEQNRDYLILNKVYLENHKLCEYGFAGCTGKSVEIDHSEGRTGARLTDVKKFKATCRNCHNLRHKNNL